MKFLCWLHGHDTDGWEQVPDRFISRQYAPCPYTREKHQMVPLWFHFFGHGKYAFKWDKQVCRCKRCGTLFWEADLRPLAEVVNEVR